jgi:hypothetical protein
LLLSQDRKQENALNDEEPDEHTKRVLPRRVEPKISFLSPGKRCSIIFRYYSLPG